MKQSAGFDTSALPPAVSSLGTPNAVYGLDTTWEYLMWFCVFGLALIALLMGLVAVKPFGVHPPPPAVGAIGFLVCGGAALGFLISLMKIRGHYYLLFPSSLVVMDYEKYVIIPWESITGLHMIGTQSANRYSVQTRDGQKYTLESYVNDVAGLATAIRQSVEHGRGSVAGASTFKANIPASAATSPRANNGFWPNVDTLEGARAAAMQGVGTSIFCCLATVAVVVLNSTSSQHLLNLGPSALIDAVFFAAIGAGIYNMSRAAAIAHTPGAGSMGGVSVMALFLTMMYVNSIRGTFAYHRLLEAGAGASQAAPVAPIADPILAPSPATYPGSGIPTPVAAQAAPVAPMASDPVRTEPPVQTGLQPRIIDDLAPDREWRPDWSGFTPSASQDIAPPSPEARWADPSFPGVRTGGWSQGAVPSRGPQTPGGPTDHAAYLD